MAKKNAKQRRKEAKGESAQSFLPIRDIRNGMVETTDGRYLKIPEIEPINFSLRSSEEQFNIISSFASWLKISPVRLQCKTITRRADSDKHIALVKEELAQEENPQCRALRQDFRHIRDAMALRRIRGLEQKLECVYVPMLMGAAQTAEELSESATSRGIEHPGKRSSWRLIGFHIQDVAVALLFLALCVGGICCKGVLP